jgi:ATP-binding cassette subfamily A (ABC1) protein 3
MHSFFKLKRRKYSKSDARIMLSRLKIDDKRHAKAATLSGGQKRKLSLAIALIGGSEVDLISIVD